MPTAQEEQVNANLDLLLTQSRGSFSHDPAAAGRPANERSERVRRTYKTATADAKDAKDKRRKWATPC